MAEGTETEIKLAATPAMLEQLRGHPLLSGPDRELGLESTYFDTAGGALHRRHASLRLRVCGDLREQTLKVPLAGGGAVCRGEWTVPASADAPQAALFPPEPARLLGAMAGSDPLAPVIVTRVQRTARRLRYRGSLIEADFDSGTIHAGTTVEPVCELELELLEGAPADLFRLARELPLGPELMWTIASKSERGRALAFGDRPASVAAAKVALAPDADVAQGFLVIARNCLDQLLANYPLVIGTGHPAAVHQSRVAIRRLRALFSLFGKALADPLLPGFRAEWKAAANGLGAARDAHVLLEGTRRAVAASGSGTGDAAEGSGALLRQLEAAQGHATGDAARMLAGEAFQHLLASFAAWLESREWRRHLAGGDTALAGFAGKLVNRRRKRLAQAAGRLAEMPDEDLHALRIAVKKLRYATEFLSPLFPAGQRASARFGKALQGLQDELGSLHDMAVAQVARQSLFGDLEPILAAGLREELERLTADALGSRKQRLRRAERLLGQVIAAPKWWRATA